MADDLTAAELSAAVERSGWRILLNTVATSVPAESLPAAARIAGAVAQAGEAAAGRLRIDVRADRVEISLEAARQRRSFTTDDLQGVRDISAALDQLGTTPSPLAHQNGSRSVQAWEIAIDAMDIPRILPFWRAVLAYADDPGSDGPADAVVDPAGQGPTVWFQQMDEPRPQRNRVHFDITVPHDEADRRRVAALAAGGTLVSDAEARAFWILADAEGNEICICTWQDRN